MLKGQGQRQPPEASGTWVSTGCVPAAPRAPRAPCMASTALLLLHFLFLHLCLLLQLRGAAWFTPQLHPLPLCPWSQHGSGKGSYNSRCCLYEMN